MMKDQKYKFTDKSVRGFRTFAEADAARKTAQEALAKAKDKASKVKVRLRADGTFDVMHYAPVVPQA